ncbi:GIY-YIG nuclease family protein [Candidatus Poribacteria bacterium]|nr:GIY-YIG nuclease family protein [Candidatus Poribacteria bacterium]
MPTPRKRLTSDPPHEVKAIRKHIKEALNCRDEEGRRVGNSKCGVYLFYDYDGEPIYVGQTYEKLRARIGRHLTNQRTDAVAMNVLDPFEVAEVEMWPLWELEDATEAERKSRLAEVEFGVFQLALRKSVFKGLLNEKEIAPMEATKLPPSYRVPIIPEDIYGLRSHPDIRIARRASTIANLARVISERSPSTGLRRTLRTQARRLEWLASERYRAFGQD